MRIVTPAGHPASVWATTLSAAPPLRLARRLDHARLLVAAAHADDETLGAAGLIMSARRRGADVTLLVCTDGSGAYPDADPAQRRQLATIRREESVQAATVLGIRPESVHHLGLPDGAADLHRPEIAARAAELGTDCAWWVAPWRHDPHPDHRAVGEALAVAMPPGTGFLEYPVWMRHGLTPRQLPALPAGTPRVLRLHRGLQARKQRAITAHTSQIRVYDQACEPVLPGHVLSLFRDGREPYFVGAHDADRLAGPLRGHSRGHS